MSRHAVALVATTSDRHPIVAVRVPTPSPWWRIEHELRTFAAAAWARLAALLQGADR
jgi:hypothetical protein